MFSIGEPFQCLVVWSWSVCQSARQSTLASDHLQSHLWTPAIRCLLSSRFSIFIPLSSLCLVSWRSTSRQYLDCQTDQYDAFDRYVCDQSPRHDHSSPWIRPEDCLQICFHADTLDDSWNGRFWNEIRRSLCSTSSKHSSVEVVRASNLLASFCQQTVLAGQTRRLWNTFHGDELSTECIPSANELSNVHIHVQRTVWSSRTLMVNGGRKYLPNVPRSLPLCDNRRASARYGLVCIVAGSLCGRSDAGSEREDANDTT